MSEKKIMICDICGLRLVDGDTEPEKRIDKAIISFEEHISIKKEIFKGDMCVLCANEFIEAFEATKNKIKARRR